METDQVKLNRSVNELSAELLRARASIHGLEIHIRALTIVMARDKIDFHKEVLSEKREGLKRLIKKGRADAVKGLSLEPEHSKLLDMLLDQLEH